LDEVDWLIVMNDKVATPYFAAAHRFRSAPDLGHPTVVWGTPRTHKAFPGLRPRESSHQDIFAHMLAFSETRSDRAIGVIWSEIVPRENVHIGVVLGRQIEHLCRVLHGYDLNVATSEARQLLERCGVRRSRHQILETSAVTTRL
jgi:hypothetical protein